MLPYHPELPGQRDFLLIHLPPVADALRSVDRTVDHGPIPVQFDDPAAIHMPE